MQVLGVLDEQLFWSCLQAHTFSYVSLLLLHYLLLQAQLLLFVGLLFLFLLFSSYRDIYLLFVATYLYSCYDSDFTLDICTCSATLTYVKIFSTLVIIAVDS